MRILVSVGQQLPFDRLIAAADACAAKHTDWHWLAQIGENAHPPQHMRYVTNLDQATFDAEFDKADIIISHAGVGTIIKAIDLRKPIVLMARAAVLGEHRNDHQKATIAKFVNISGVYQAVDGMDLGRVLARLALNQSGGYGTVISGAADTSLLAMVAGFVAEHDGTGGPSS